MSGGGCAGLLLAAGSGSRMGTPKALVRFEDRLLVERGIDLLREGGCGPLVVVLGAAADEVRRQADLDGVDVVVAESWAEGMGASLRAGLTALRGGACTAGAAVVALVDQPLVGAGAVERLIAAWRDGAPAAVASYGGAPRNPVLLDRALWHRIAEDASGDVGARPFLRAHPELVLDVPADETGAPDDVDTPEDLATALARVGVAGRSEQRQPPVTSQEP